MRLALALILTSAAPSVAEVSFGLPLDCELGVTCFIEDHHDAQPGPGQRDFACGFRSRDGHRGTDFALPDLDAMRAGVDVLAVADGVVDATRDGMIDLLLTPERRAEIRGRECGNAVRVLHENGMHTLYCHLARGSIAVRRGQTVARGDVLGRVGLSGETNFPHVHLGVLIGETRVDPFAPDAEPGTCAPADGPQLFDPPIPYQKTGYLTAGISDAAPTLQTIHDGSARRDEVSTGDPLVLYVRLHDALPGDDLTFSMQGPDGREVFTHEMAFEQTQRDMFHAHGRRAPADGWAPGRYEGFTTLMRDGRLLGTRTTYVEVR